MVQGGGSSVEVGVVAMSKGGWFRGWVRMVLDQEGGGGGEGEELPIYWLRNKNTIFHKVKARFSF